MQTSGGSPKKILVDDPDEMLQLADLEGVSVDCPELTSDPHLTGRSDGIILNCEIIRIYVSTSLTCVL